MEQAVLAAAVRKAIKLLSPTKLLNTTNTVFASPHQKIPPSLSRFYDKETGPLGTHVLQYHRYQTAFYLIEMHLKKVLVRIAAENRENEKNTTIPPKLTTTADRPMLST